LAGGCSFWFLSVCRVIRLGYSVDKYLQYYAPVGLNLIQSIGTYRKSFTILLERKGESGELNAQGSKLKAQSSRLKVERIKVNRGLRYEDGGLSGRAEGGV